MPSSTTSTEAPAPARPSPLARSFRLACGAALLCAWAVYLAVGLRARLGLSAVVLFLVGVALLWSIQWLYRSLAALAIDRPAAHALRFGGAVRQELLREKRTLLKAIKELEFDHAMGKLSDADYHDIVGRYRASAVAVLRRLDEGAVTYRTLIEREVQRRLAAAATEPAARADARVCPACALKNDDDATFCKSCGARLTEVEP
jgi:hypothetical protein